MFRVVPIAEEHIEGFRAGLDSVARERRYLLFLEAPPPEDVGKFLRNSMRKGYPQYVALVGDRVVGWCDVLPIDRPTRAHNGMLGISVVTEYRGRAPLYERFGFVYEGVQRKAVRVDGAYEDLICMALLFDGK